MKFPTQISNAGQVPNGGPATIKLFGTCGTINNTSCGYFDRLIGSVLPVLVAQGTANERRRDVEYAEWKRREDKKEN